MIRGYTVKLLRRTIRNLILESWYATDMSSIEWMIAKLGLLKHETEVVIDHKDQSGHDLVIKINALIPNGELEGKPNFLPERLAVLQIDSTEENCLNAFEVSYSYIRRKHRHLGLGPLMYEVAMEYITKEYGVGLTCDRMTVSEHAYPVWEKFLERSKTDPDITTELLDFNFGPEDKKFTPNVPGDDCEEGTGTDWYLTLKEEDPWGNEGPEPKFIKWWKEENPTAYVYKKSPAKTIAILEDLKILKIQK